MEYSLFMINQRCCTQSHELEGRGSIQIMNLLRTVNSNQLSVFMTRPGAGSSARCKGRHTRDARRETRDARLYLRRPPPRLSVYVHTANKPREESRCDLYMFSAMASLFVARKVARQERLLHALPTSTSHTGTTRTAMKPPQRDPRSSPRIIASHARNPWITARCQI